MDMFSAPYFALFTGVLFICVPNTGEYRPITAKILNSFSNCSEIQNFL